MDIRFVVPDLRRLDDLKSEALCVPVFSDERPLRGAPGLIDWRLCGLLSGLLRDGKLLGAAGERLLIPARPRLTFEKLFVFGLGARDDFEDEDFDRAVEAMLTTLRKARVRASVMVLPGRPVEAVDAVAAMERFLTVAARHPEHDEVTLVEDPEAQKAMAPVVEQAKRRARAEEV